jgi:hypothetical protein
VDRIGPCVARCVEDRVAVEVRVDGSDVVHAVRPALAGRLEAHHPHPEHAGAARDPRRDLAAVGDQQRPDRVWRRLPTGRCDPRHVAVRGPLRDRRERRTRHAEPAADPLRREPAVADPTLDGADRDAELVRNLAGRQRLIGHVAIVALGARRLGPPGRRPLLEEC